MMTSDISDDTAAFLEAVNRLSVEAVNALSSAESGDILEELQQRLMGRRGQIRALSKGLSTLPHGDRPRAGSALQRLTAELGALIDDKRSQFRTQVDSTEPRVDATLPGIDVLTGGLHPTIQMMYDLNDAFGALNFEVYEGPEITSELYEFDNLNFPPEHPARESMDTFWLARSADRRGAERLCLRPHLTGASVRFMQLHDPPLRIVYPGRVYRQEATDTRHERAFFQYEALIIERQMPFSSGKLLVDTVLQTVFGYPVRTRMRVGFFPFVEPGFEIDMECQVCQGRGCSICKNVGWLEVMPGGMPHPNVLIAGGIDPDQWMGFYLNVGLDRLVMMRYGIDDVRLFHAADIRFLEQFK